MVGWLLWGVLTSMAYAAGYLFAQILFDEESSARRWTATFALGPALILIAIQLASAGHLLATYPLALVSLVVFGAPLAYAARLLGRARIFRTLRSDLLAPKRIVLSAWREREIAFLAVPIAAGVFVLACVLVWFYRSWMFDPIWYHVTITNYAIQERGLDWIHSHNHYVSGYPRNVELIATWNCIFPMDNRLDDSPQLPFVLLGLAATAAWARRMGASRALAASAAGIWYALPPVFLLAPSSYVDLATGAMFVAGVFFTFGKDSGDRWLSLVCFGLYVGSKFTGVYHFALCAPILLYRIVAQWPSAPKAPNGRLVWALDVAGSFVAFAALGAFKYVQNFIHEGNPVFPYATKTPFGKLPGPETVAGIYNINVGPGESLYLFGTKGAFRDALKHWLAPPAEFRYTPEVHEGGFGPTFWWFLFPVLVVALVESLRGRWRTHLPLVLVFVLAISVPSAYWPRYSIGGVAALAVLLVVFLSEIKPRLLRMAVSLALVWMTFVNARQALQGWQEIFPVHFAQAVRATPNERAAMGLGMHWAARDGLQREFELRAGDVVTYDESASFLANYFTRDYRNRVLFVSSRNATDYVARLKRVGTVWAGVARGSAAEAALVAAGATFLFPAPGTDTVLYRMPRAIGMN